MVLNCRNVVVQLLGCCYTVSEVLVVSERGCVASRVLLCSCKGVSGIRVRLCGSKNVVISWLMYSEWF